MKRERQNDTAEKQTDGPAHAGAGMVDDICAFIVDGRHVCFHCYDPNEDKDEDILSSGFFEKTNHCICSRCNGIIRPERRVKNRRGGVDRRVRQEPIAGQDRRSGEERRRGESRRKTR